MSRSYAQRLVPYGAFFVLLFSLATPFAALAATTCCSCTPPNGAEGCYTIDAEKLTGGQRVTGACSRLTGIATNLAGYRCKPDPLSDGECKPTPPGVCGAGSVDAFTGQPAGDAINKQKNADQVVDAPIIPQLNVPIPGLTFQADKSTQNPLLAQYLGAGYNYLISISAVAATIMFVYGAFQYLIGSALPSVSNGKRIMQDAVIGMMLVLGASLIIKTINPNLTHLPALNVDAIRAMQIQNESVLSTDVQIQSGGSVTPVPFKGTFLSFDNKELAASETILARSETVPQPLTVPSFKQYIGPWANRAYGPPSASACPSSEDRPLSEAGCCTTYARAGCGATSLAMILSANGLTVDPGQVGSALVATGARTCNNGTGFAKGAMQQISVNGSVGTLKSLGTGLPAVKSAIEELRKGQPVMFLCGNCKGKKKDGSYKTYPGHYMVLTGVDPDGKVLVVSDVGNANGILNIVQSELTAHSGGFWVVSK